jgi:ketosteroid isomerase-like protein
MSEQQMMDTVRSFLKSIEGGEVNKSLSFLTDDVVWIVPQGTFKGSAEVQRYLTWIKQTTKDYEARETGIGILVQGNTVIIEHNLAGTYNGKRWEIPAMCIYEFRSGEKIQELRTFYDSLAQAQQAVKGFIPRWAINKVVKATRKGLQ